MSASSCIVWLRDDLRLADNPALHAAAALGKPVILVFIWSPDEEGKMPMGAASRWWLHQSLSSLSKGLARLGQRIIIREGDSLSELNRIIRECESDSVYWNRCYEPSIVDRDNRVKLSLSQQGIDIKRFNGRLLFEPGTVLNSSGKPFQVFGAFWRACLRLEPPAAPLPAPSAIPLPKEFPPGILLDQLALEPTIDWTRGMRQSWIPGETGAHIALEQFIHQGVRDYPIMRNHPGLPGTSRLSPHLRFGEVSPRQIWHRLSECASTLGTKNSPWWNHQYVTELGWREFAYQLLFHFPKIADEPLRPEFNRFRWRENAEWLKAWQRGVTGYPLVDAGMRELWTTGWMHNRVRMIVGSFLVKHLLISWKHGAEWFWDTLVDADLANNTLGWQWISGCGADAAPYFRIFNPVSQGERFDPTGDYIRQWVPELGRLPDEWIHKPFNAPRSVLDQAEIKLGDHYPEPIVSHMIARELALEAYARMKAET